jgi:hypothetical protein
MGNFLALTSVIGKTKNEVVTSLTNYANSVSGGLQQENNIDSDTDNCCIIDEQNGNISIFYPNGYLEWDDSSAFISKELNATVFSFHIHDGDFWMYVLYNNGQGVDQFNPVPDYWDDNISNEEIASWKGNADIVVQHIKGIKKSDIDKYLVKWDLEKEDTEKAYTTDEFGQEDWQLIDFMSKLNLPYPLDDNGNPKGTTFKLWTKQLKLETVKISNTKTETKSVKPWWKFW